VFDSHNVKVAGRRIEKDILLDSGFDIHIKKWIKRCREAAMPDMKWLTSSLHGKKSSDTFMQA
jgi:hypothetical protein